MVVCGLGGLQYLWCLVLKAIVTLHLQWCHNWHRNIYPSSYKLLITSLWISTPVGLHYRLLYGWVAKLSMSENFSGQVKLAAEQTKRLILHCFMKTCKRIQIHTPEGDQCFCFWQYWKFCKNLDSNKTWVSTGLPTGVMTRKKSQVICPSLVVV